MLRKVKEIAAALQVRTEYECEAEHMYTTNGPDGEHDKVLLVHAGLEKLKEIRIESSLIIEELKSMPHFEERYFDEFFHVEAYTNDLLETATRHVMIELISRNNEEAGEQRVILAKNAASGDVIDLGIEGEVKIVKVYLVDDAKHVIYIDNGDEQHDEPYDDFLTYFIDNFG
jgi:hypothetical protein